jgi:multiple sugar transport system ATP-binding protein
MGDKISVIKDGFLLQTGTPLEIYNNPINQFTAGFVGKPPMNFFETDILRKSNGDIYLNEGSFEVFAKEGKYKEKLMQYLGQKAILGIRPQDLHIQTENQDDKANQFKAVIEFIEAFGNQTYLHCKAGDKKVIINTQGQNQAKIADEIDVSVDISKIYIFNIADGSSII